MRLCGRGSAGGGTPAYNRYAPYLCMSVCLRKTTQNRLDPCSLAAGSGDPTPIYLKLFLRLFYFPKQHDPTLQCSAKWIQQLRLSLPAGTPGGPALHSTAPHPTPGANIDPAHLLLTPPGKRGSRPPCFLISPWLGVRPKLTLAPIARGPAPSKISPTLLLLTGQFGSLVWSENIIFPQSISNCSFMKLKWAVQAREKKTKTRALNQLHSVV